MNIVLDDSLSWNIPVQLPDSQKPGRFRTVYVKTKLRYMDKSSLEKMVSETALSETDTPQEREYKMQQQDAFLVDILLSVDQDITVKTDGGEDVLAAGSEDARAMFLTNPFTAKALSTEYMKIMTRNSFRG